MSEIPARFITPRDHTRATLGPKAARLAAAMGTPFMPWQQAAADVALELNPDGTFRYHDVVITVPRQSGKTTMTLALGLHRLLTVPAGKVWYTAQTGQSARERFIADLVPPAERVLGPLITVNRGAGDTRMIFKPTGAQYRPHPPNDKYLHGEQSDMNLIDEPWALSETAGDGLMQAVIPTQNTRPNAQTIFLSTMGTADSSWWHNLVDAAREGQPRTCLIDYGVPDGMDGSDPDVVMKYHPAVGRTINPQAIYDAATRMKPSEFSRAYGNQRTATRHALFSTDTLERVITAAHPISPASPVAFGVAVSWDRSRAVIMAAGYAEDDLPTVELVEARPGYSWATDRVKDLHEKHTPLATVIDSHGPSSTLATDPALEGLVTAPKPRELAAATADLLDRITGARIHLRKSTDLATALDVVTLRTVGELGQLIDRKNSPGSVAALEAAMLALFGLTRSPDPAPAPLLVTL